MVGNLRISSLHRKLLKNDLPSFCSLWSLFSNHLCFPSSSSHLVNFDYTFFRDLNQPCSCYTRPPWATVSSRYQTLQKSRVQIYGRNLKRLSRRISCSSRWSFLSARLPHCLFFQTEAEGSAPVHLNSHCGGRYFCHTKWEDWQGIETVSNRRSTGEGKGQGVSGGYWPSSWCAPPSIIRICFEFV